MRNQTWGEPGSPDIYAIGYFASIVDRNILGHDTWDSYCNFLWLVFNEDPTSDFIEQCIIIDYSYDLEIPELIPV